jgi:nucleoside phosphorylase
MTRRCVGIVAAMGAEARVLTGTTPPVRTVVPVADGVLLWISGVGGEATGQGCQALVAAGAGALASVGTAAGLAPECVPGTLVLPRQVIPAGSAPIPVDEAWRRALQSAIGKKLTILDGPVAATDGVLGSAGKEALYRRTGAVSADMESAAVAVSSARLGVPLMVVRAISDGRSDAVPPGILKTVDAFGRPDYGRLLAFMARRPAEIGTVLRLAAGFRAACRTLRLVVRSAGPRLHCPD